MPCCWINFPSVWRAKANFIQNILYFHTQLILYLQQMVIIFTIFPFTNKSEEVGEVCWYSDSNMIINFWGLISYKVLNDLNTKQIKIFSSDLFFWWLWYGVSLLNFTFNCSCCHCVWGKRVSEMFQIIQTENVYTANGQFQFL